MFVCVAMIQQVNTFLPYKWKKFMRIITSILACAVTASNLRRLIIDGQFDDLSSYPHSVALMICRAPTKANPNYVCGIHCSGSLIAPNAVVTAAHCVRDPQPAYDGESLYIDFDMFYVLAGSTDYDVVDWSSKSRLVKVKRAVHAGIGTNIRFPLDGDVALLELEECVEPIPDQIGYVKVATVKTEPANDNCQSITVSGFGQISNAPDPVRDDDGRRRIVTDVLQTHAVCRDAYVASIYGWTNPNQGTAQPVDYETVTPEQFLCTGGSSLRSVCYGDSGGGYVGPLNDGLQVVGVVSFGIGDFCTTSPDYSSRLSFRAKWILDQLKSGFSMCPSWGDSWEKSFASWPVPQAENFSDIYKSSRCPSLWQCLDGKKCIDHSLVCNKQSDCEDGSDEDSDYCATSPAYNERRAIKAAEADVFESRRSGHYLTKEFEEILQRKSEWVSLSAEKLVKFSQMEGSGTSSGIVITGVIRAAAKAVRPTPKSTSDGSVDNGAGWPTRYSGTPNSCGQAMIAYQAALLDAKTQDTRDDHWNPTMLSHACIDVGICAGDRSRQDIYDAESVCDSLKSFLNWNITALDYANNFNQRFDASCRSPSPPGFDPKQDGNVNTPKSVELTITGVLFALSIVGLVAF